MKNNKNTNKTSKQTIQYKTHINTHKHNGIETKHTKNKNKTITNTSKRKDREQSKPETKPTH